MFDNGTSRYLEPKLVGLDPKLPTYRMVLSPPSSNGTAIFALTPESQLRSESTGDLSYRDNRIPIDADEREIIYQSKGVSGMTRDLFYIEMKEISEAIWQYNLVANDTVATRFTIHLETLLIVTGEWDQFKLFHREMEPVFVVAEPYY